MLVVKSLVQSALTLRVMLNYHWDFHELCGADWFYGGILGRVLGLAGITPGDDNVSTAFEQVSQVRR